MRNSVITCLLILSIFGCREKVLTNSITWDSHGFKVNGRYTLFLIGGIQYYRIPPGEWEDRLRKMKGAGINLVEVYLSWAFHEPEEGRFDFSSPTHDLERFLLLCEKVGLFVYVRPGPYITNETDGGGLPGWLLKSTSAQPSASEDGEVSVRQVDADYLAYAARYLSNADAIIRRHQFTTNPDGRVLFYALENEYDWFYLFKSLEGGPIPDVRGMFTRLRDIVKSHGISVPLTDASGIPPGNSFFKGTGDVDGVLITPNQYPGTAGELGQKGPYSMEKVTALAMSDLHSSSSHKGLYVNTPSFVSETDRLITLLQRTIFGGMEGANLFNFVGYTVEGYQNGVDILFGGNVVEAIANPAVAYFGGQIDYRAPVSPRGVIRSTYFTMKRKMEFLNAFSEPIASCGEAKKDGVISVANPDIGTWEGTARSRYWLETDDGTVFLSLLNQGAYDTGTQVSSPPTDETIGIGGITAKGVSFPNYITMTVPYENIATTVSDETWNDMILPIGLSLGDGYPRLAYSTSEILTLKDFNGRKLLVLYGREGTYGETRLTGTKGLPGVNYSDLAGFQLDENDGDTLTFHYLHAPDTFIVLGLPNGKVLEILVTTIERANRYWFFESGGRQFMAAGVDFLEGTEEEGGTVTMRTQRRRGPGSILILTPFSPEYMTDDALLWIYAGFSYTPEAMALSYTAAVSYSLPTLPSINYGRTFSESLPSHSQAGMSWTGTPKSLEELGISRGHAWYMTEFSAASPLTTAALHIDSASDFVSAYLNGIYITTAAPTGLPIDLALPGSAVTVGTNTVVFRVQVWGHSIYHIPQMSGAMNIPILALDSKRGLMGRARVTLGGTTADLTEWNAIDRLEGERSRFFDKNYDISRWQTPAQPITPGTRLDLQDGQTLWYRAQFDSSSLPDPQRIFAPVLIRLKGKNCVGTIWLNDRLIGRWLSDNDWLIKGVDTSSPGTAKRAARDMWLEQEPGDSSLDKFYLPTSYITPGINTITIALEDMSNPDYPGPPDPGYVDSLEIVYNTDEWTSGTTGTLGSLLKSVISLHMK